MDRAIGKFGNATGSSPGLTPLGQMFPSPPIGIAGERSRIDAFGFQVCQTES